ncbi:efflux transporter outer membrane subunit [Pseudooceanicola sp. CBS1P-1]|uniref:Efflux transporter outer membrane subunit n=2 Tax=Paracoccaceae TaxID=31989 RepID=A0A6L7G6K9_9RHOB|nr:efflux transporter outer membrane subunit [Pseudooceanicola endophyticus]MXN19934.1 efflux transporter outer membrane subunit [Pseudooceanicola albus]
MQLMKLAPLVLVAGCAAVGPNYKAPDVAVTRQFVGGDSGPLAQVAYRPWWRDYKDPMLNELVETGMKQSLSILQAQERIRQARAQLRQTGINSALSGSAEVDKTRAGTDGGTASWSTTSSLGASFVIDLFGGVRREQEAAKANLAASQANVGTERLAWLAELVADYADARYYQQALELTRKTIETRKGTLDITQQELNAGAATDYEVAEAQAALQSAQADLPSYLAQFRAQVFAIATLLNVPAGPLMQKMEKGAPQLSIPGTIATGVPADLLRNRPDVRYYEAVLHQQVADVGVAQADLYPSLTLSGTVSGTSSTTSWSFGPSITQAIFNQGSLRAARDAQVSAAKQAEIDYRSTISGAVEDVQVAQSNLKQYRAQAAQLQQAADSYSRALGLAQTTYRNGAMTLLDLLDTDRSEASARISAASARNQAAQQWATLQIAIGAGAGYAESPEEQPLPPKAPAK